ncbi:3-phenylpropionate/cinnamic acid dioxygenase subunit beta [Pseudonocardia sp. K10HN5]|uniref:3-phenylpropionate/cinnamic acid dioxygenase subunit beta n=2 Tax=Pseudonocardia acidicola TaxID=2724939 RepID=A0ABX1SEX8_9PSEU|nr:3-phenylpropionate/cinnamic acid dioxygenase subunit beta [Pseudonocardia acidicola]NMH99660.1 3-phenylpropionate/cinnamic acid dioxygenase subunit beta [Pseudonocardia acidicola]
MALHFEVSRFLYREARLLDEERYDDWLALFTPDVRYWVPGVENRMRRDPLGSVIRSHMAYFDDNFTDLSRRVARFQAPTAWAEDPATRHVHLVTNIEVDAVAAEPGADPLRDGEEPAAAGELLVRSVLVSYRNRNHDEEDVLSARRTDVLRRTDDGLRIARRTVVMGQSVLLSQNINTFL